MSANKATWKEARYGYTRLDLGILSLSVGWASTKPDGYVWTVDGRSPRSVARYATAAEAQEAAETWAKKELLAALERLGIEAAP